MASINFKRNTKLPGHSYSYLHIDMPSGKRTFQPSMFKEEITDIDLPLELILNSEEEKEYGAKVFSLVNGQVLVIKKYSYTLYPSLQDLKNNLIAKAHWQKAGRNYTPDVHYRKIIDYADPKKRVILTSGGDERVYYQYSARTTSVLLEDLKIVERIVLGGKRTKLVGHDGRVCYLAGSAYEPTLLFLIEEDYNLWYRVEFEWKEPELKVWRGRNPYHESFLSHREQLLQKLADILELQREDLVFGPGKHHNVHRALEQLIFTDRVVNLLFLPLVVYLGEQQIRVYGG
ncbi:MAG: hypothetical protein KDC54_23650, partial [Lewinella sp.]|nr:hypothetical protein [Lewinella sp.]